MIVVEKPILAALVLRLEQDAACHVYPGNSGLQFNWKSHRC